MLNKHGWWWWWLVVVVVEAEVVVRVIIVIMIIVIIIIKKESHWLMLPPLSDINMTPIISVGLQRNLIYSAPVNMFSRTSTKGLENLLLIEEEISVQLLTYALGCIIRWKSTFRYVSLGRELSFDR